MLLQGRLETLGFFLNPHSSVRMLGDVQTSLGRTFCSNCTPSGVSLSPVLSQPSTGPSNILLLFSRRLSTPLLPFTTIPPTRISAGRNLFFPSHLQAGSLQFSQWIQQEKRRSHTWALKSTACLLAGYSRPYCSFSHTHCHLPFFTYSPCCQNTTITVSSTHIPEHPSSNSQTLAPTRGEVRVGVGTHPTSKLVAWNQGHEITSPASKYLALDFSWWAGKTRR